MWQLHTRIGAYDLPYAALAEQRSLSLVTSGARLARAATELCRVELVA
jgi:predicted nucleic acid-binding protein